MFECCRGCPLPQGALQGLEHEGRRLHLDMLACTLWLLEADCAAGA